MKKILLSLVLVFSGLISASAQSDLVMPFMPNILQSVYTNPTNMPEYRIMIGLPGISYLAGDAFNSQFAANQLFRERPDGQYVLDPTKVINGLKKDNLTHFGFGTDILHLKLNIKGIYFGFNITNKFDANARLSSNFLKLAWNGNGAFINPSQPATFKDMGINLTHYNEIGASITVPIKKTLVLGIRPKMLLGLLNMSTPRMSGTLTTDSSNAYAINFGANALVNTSFGGLNADSVFSGGNAGSLTANEYMRNTKNKGYAIDFGLSYKLNQDWTFTGMLTDVGYINWQQNTRNYSIDFDSLRFKGLTVKEAFGNGQSLDFKKLQDSIFNQIKIDSSRNAYRTSLTARYGLMAEYQVFKNTSLGAGVFGDFSTGRMPAITVNAYQRLGRFINLAVNWSYRDESVENLGIGFMMKPGTMQLYAVTDNILTAFNPDKHRSFNARVGLNLVIGNAAPNDRDGDGVPDKEDKCPKTKGERVLKGCPDTDLDGIGDSEDKCPSVPGIPEFGGCPDSDEDNIEDRNDECPYDYGTPQFKGCPDTDGDGIRDKDDACPKVFGVAKLNGCPDTDGDGIGDGEDKCPTIKGLPENRGCPDTDGDGVFDDKDSCRTQKGPMENAGCPWPDSDRDLVPDKDDKCPLDSGAVAREGCPYPDTDTDGVLDDKDKCPNAPGPANTNGCPDTDSDGLSDDVDKCPTEAGTKEEGGCPLKDSDGDGILDKDDKCPDKAGLKEDFGCPLTDSDGDGFSDKYDKCPDLKGIKENAGCPDVDSDGDGIVDRLDECPHTAGVAANKGCPELKKEEKAAIQTAFANLEFETGTFKIKDKSLISLDGLAKVLMSRNNSKLKISGHTDNKGKEPDNLWLSRKRAESVREYLMTKGVPQDRFIIEFFGSSKPIASNKTEAGRIKNRRVEMKITFD